MKTFVLLATLATIGLAAPVAVNEDKRALANRENFNGIYIGPDAEGETPEKRENFDGIYIGPSVEGETATKKRENFDGIYIGPSVEGETAA